MYEAISEQKNVIMKCLDSDQCDINALNEQLEILQAMQEKYRISWRFFATHSHDIYFLRYSKLEFEQARNLWMAGVRHLGETASEAEYETQFSVLVEQEVEKRLFQVSRLCIQHTLCQIIIFLSNFWKNFQSSEFYFLNTI